MRYDLAALSRRVRNTRRSRIIIRDIAPPATLASDLYLAGYRPIIEVWTRYGARIAADYERTLASMTTDSPADLQRDLDEAQSEIERLYILLNAEMRDWAIRTERWFRGKWRGAVLAASGVDIGTLIGPEDARQTLETAIQWNVNLVKDVSDQARNRISTAVFDGLRNRTPAREVAKRITEATGMAKRRATAISSDQLAKITSSLADERRREAGIEKWMWHHSRKAHPREDHKARDGNIYSDDDAPADRPSQLPYCGCRARAVISYD